MGGRALCLILLGLLAGSSYAQSCSLITSNVLRIDSEETFIVDGHGTEMNGHIRIYDFPKKKGKLAEGPIAVNSNNGFLGTTKFLVPSKFLDKDPNKKQYVYVIVDSPNCKEEKVVLVSYQSGYIFIQTDKPIYTPGSTVNFRIFSMTPDLKLVNKPVSAEVVTPENVSVQKYLQAASGIISLTYKLNELASIGTWTIVAMFQDNLIHNYTTYFEVKEYVLPSFEVKIIPSSKYFHFKVNEFSLQIQANYLYGKPLQGVAYVLFSIKKDEERRSLPDTLRRVTISDGEGQASLQRKDLVKYFKQETDMLEWKLSVSVTVITDSGSDMVETELNDIYIVTSPYKILFTKTSKFFKPGMPFDLMVFVTNPDGSPASRVPVVGNPGPVGGSTSEDGTVRLSVNTNTGISSLTISVNTNDPRLMDDDKQAKAEMIATAYRPKSGNYLHIGVSGGEKKLGENAEISFNIRTADENVNSQITHFNYVILNKGRIWKVGRQERAQGQHLIKILLPITADLIPSFRFLAYYTVTTVAGREIVADSVWIDVADTCMGTLELSAYQEKDKIVQAPGASVNLKLKADPKAQVGLVAVDKGVYVMNSKNKISQTKVWDSVEKYDVGCTPGGGADAAGVFYDAGLALGNNFHGSTLQRSEPLCHGTKKRRRRDTAALIQTKDAQEFKYEGEERVCCRDGMRELPMKISCEKRAKRIQDGAKCAAAFLDCCNHMEKIKATESLKDDLARSDEDLQYILDDDILSRTEFPESWHWKIETMNEPEINGVSTKIISLILKDSITTWEVLPVSLSENKGICVGKPYDIQVFQSFFIDLRLPYAVVRNEQVEIRAILYNYGNTDLNLKIFWSYNEEFCSLATAKSKYHQQITLRKSSSMAIPFIIIPLTLGYHDVEVKAAGTTVADGVRKKLKVVPEGKRIVQNLANVILEPEARGGSLEVKVKAVDLKNVVPNSPIETIVTVQGTAISEMVEKAIDGANLNNLIVAPWGCGEQNMMSMTPCVIATHYLDASNQWDRVGVERRAQAIQFINNGLANQLKYHKEDGSYGIWIYKPSSTWLTAYVVKVFALSSDLIEVKKEILCDSVKWLLLNRQKPDGLFEETNPVYDQDRLVGGIKTGAVELDVTMTSFVLIAMLESETYCRDHVNNLKSSIDKAVSYIEQQYDTITKPYSIALASYALAKAQKLGNINKLMSAATEKNHWVEPNSHHLTLEATSYALLALVEKKEFARSALLVRWLTEQRFHGVVYGSTQATVMVFQATAKYLTDAPTQTDLNMDVAFKLPGRTASTTIRLNNALNSRTEQTQKIGDFVVTATGKGQGTLSAFVSYYAIETEKEKSCNSFFLSVEAMDEPLARRPEGAHGTVSLSISFRHLKSQDSGMALVIISMMTGFAVDTDDLNKLKQGKDSFISNYEINKGAFDKSTLVLYFNKISHSEEESVKFNLHQYFKVGLIQPGSVTIRDYYSPENYCTKFYHPQEESKLLGKICQGEVCRCAEATCYLQQSLEEVDAGVRLDKACLVGVDYVYKIKLTEIIKPDENYYNYVVTIETVIKAGTDITAEGNKRTFITHAKCHQTLDKEIGMQIGKSFLVWGVSKDLWNVGGPGYSYLITKDTWVELWPTERECQNPEYEQLCEELSAFSEELQFTGCPS
ncbi:venom factor-like [Hyperolius riggenbachi]|uniref:venom factor-like n=1 Tax=Hyperolius riggenbachi TaxID=752182 RepID=UPI0035A34DD9